MSELEFVERKYSKASEMLGKAVRELADLRDRVTEYAQRCHSQFGTIERLQAENDRLRKALKRHHDWHLAQGQDNAHRV